jgi:transposase-like protein
MLKNLLEKCMEEELTYYLKARKYQRSSERGSYRNGYYTRSLDTKLWVISSLSIPRSRNGGFKTKVS